MSIWKFYSQFSLENKIPKNDTICVFSYIRYFLKHKKRQFHWGSYSTKGSFTWKNPFCHKGNISCIIRILNIWLQTNFINRNLYNWTFFQTPETDDNECIKIIWMSNQIFVRPVCKTKKFEFSCKLAKPLFLLMLKVKTN